MFNDVVTSGPITPPIQARGTFQSTDHQTTLVLPSSLVGAAAALGDTETRGTAITQVHLKLNRRTGVITGMPNHRDSGTFPFTVEVLDKKTTTKTRSQDVMTKALSITVS